MLISRTSLEARSSAYAENTSFINWATPYTTTIYGGKPVHSDKLCFIFPIPAGRGTAHRKQQWGNWEG